MERCSSCNGAWHPSTGHSWTPTMRLCWRCTLEFIQWLKKREREFSQPWRRPPSKMTFLEAAATSIRARG